jgi:GDP-L-fucose synthase
VIENAKVLVAGGSGFLGANLLLRLLSMGCDVRSTLRSDPIIKDDRIDYVYGDLSVLSNCRKAVSGIDCVFMMAANTSGAAVIANSPLDHVTPNVVMNAYMLQAAHEAGVKKFVFISSSVVYAESGNCWVKEEETMIGNPPSVYFSVGWMKRYAEILCQIYAQRVRDPMSCLVIRPSNIYGPYDKFSPEHSHVTAALIRKVTERQSPLEVWGTGEDVRDILYVDDFIDGLLMAVERSENYLTLNLAYGKGYSVNHILQTILDIDGYTDAVVQHNVAKPTTIPIRLMDTYKAKALLGWAPKVSLADGLGRTVAWYKENKDHVR